MDDRTLSVRLNRPVAHFPMLLADQSASVLKRENVEKWDVWWSNSGTVSLGNQPFLLSGLPVGAGPFKLSKLNLQTDECELERNQHYWSRKAYLDRVVFRSDGPRSAPGEPGRQVAGLFAQGLIDYVAAGIDNASSINPSAQKLTLKGIQQIEYLLFNPTVPPFDQLRFRRALTAASREFRSGDESSTRLLPKWFAPEDSAIRRVAFDPEMARLELAACECEEQFLQTAFEYITNWVVPAGTIGDLIF